MGGEGKGIEGRGRGGKGKERDRREFVDAIYGSAVGTLCSISKFR